MDSLNFIDIFQIIIGAINSTCIRLALFSHNVDLDITYLVQFNPTRLSLPADPTDSSVVMAKNFFFFFAFRRIPFCLEGDSQSSIKIRWYNIRHRPKMFRNHNI